MEKAPAFEPHSNRRLLAGLLGAYFLLLLALSPIRPLWLDEVMQLVDTRDLAGSELLSYIRLQPGQSPLGYLLQHYVIGLAGYSILTARIVAVLFGAGSCFVIALLCQELNRPRTTALVLLWMALPIQLRYATEARPYSQAIFFSAAATLLLVRLIRAPSWQRALLYALAVAAGLYSVPYTLFPQVGYVAALMLRRVRLRAIAYAAVGLTIAGLSFVPWAAWAKAGWQNSIETQHFALRLTPKFPLMVLQEISGGGYACSIPLIILAAMGFWSHGLNRFVKCFLACGIATSMILVLVVDGLFHYFFAVRQLLFILIPLTLLGAEGAAWILTRKRLAAVAILGVYFVGALVKDIHYFSDRSDDWAASAHALQSKLDSGYCMTLLPGDTAAYYVFFEPRLKQRLCGDSGREDRVVVPITRYMPAADVDRMREALRLYYREDGVETAGNTRLLLYRRI